MRLWVVDTSPLIFLAKLDRLDLLKRGADQIVVPPQPSFGRLTNTLMPPVKKSRTRKGPG